MQRVLCSTAQTWIPVSPVSQRCQGEIRPPLMHIQKIGFRLSVADDQQFHPMSFRIFSPSYSISRGKSMKKSLLRAGDPMKDIRLSDQRHPFPIPP